MYANSENANVEPKPRAGEIDHEDGRSRALETLSYLLDDAIPIPGTKYRIGTDPILGVVPIVGDALALVPSLYLVLEAAYMGLNTVTIG